MDFALCVIVNVCIAVMFKMFPGYKINALHAIVINYSICLVMGSLLDPISPIPFHPDILSASWFIFDVALGTLFICGFALTAKAVAQSGITLTTMMQKMSLIVTVSFTVLIFHEPFGILQGTGLLLAIVAIVSINNKKSGELRLQEKSYFQLILVLFFSAAIETILFYVDHSGIAVGQHHTFTTHGFGCAAIIGWISIGVKSWRNPQRISRNDFLAGILLGIPNFFSIFLLLRMLENGWNATIMYPLVNVSVLLTSTLVAAVMFRERLRPATWVGMAFAVLAILIIGYSHFHSV